MSKTRKNTMAERQPDSKRSKKRNARGFTASRPNRRAEKRLGVAMSAHAAGSRLDASAFTKPGAINHW
jgi:hypothetical protein